MAEPKVRVVIAGDASQLKRAFDEAESASEGFAGRIVGTLGKIGLALGAALTAAGGAVAGFVAKSGIQWANFQEQTLNSFETMLGSADQARQFLDELVTFAAKTPFELPGLVESSKLLLAFGFQAEEIIPIMTRVGDAVAGLGGGPEVMDGIIRALGQMQAKGKATAEEMMQLAERGIPAWRYLADAMGVSVAEAMDRVSKGAVTADQAISAILYGMEQDFSGLMEKQSTTWSGMLSTLSDTFNQFSGTVMAPIFERLKNALAGILEFVSRPEFMEFGKRLGESIAGGIDRVASFANSTLLPTLRSVYEAIRLLVTGDFRGGIFGLAEDHPAIGALLRLRELALSLGGEVVAQVRAFFAALRGDEGGESFGAKLGEGFRNTIDLVRNEVLPALREFANWFVNEGIPKVQQFANTVRPVIEPVFGFLKDNLPTIVPLLATFAGAFAGLSTASSLLGGLVGPLTQVFTILRGAFSIGPMISTIVGLLGGPLTAAIIAIAAIVAVAFMAWQNNWFGIRDIVSQVWSTVGPILEQVISAVTSFASELIASWQRWAGEIAPLAQGAWENVRNAIQTVLNVLLPLITGVLSGIANFIRSHSEEIKQIISGAWQVIRSVIEMVMGVIQGIIKTVLAVIAGDWRGAWDGIKEVASSIWEGIKGIISGALDMIKGVVSIALDAIKAIWGSIWEGIKQVASSIWEGIKSTVSSTIDTVKAVISTTLDAIKRTWETIWEGVKTTLATVWDTIKRTVIERIGDVVAEVRGLESKVTSALSGAVNWLYNAGRDIIQGLINGITSMVSSIVSAVVNTVTSAIDAAKRTLGISSPSKVFMQIGLETGAGLVAGIDRTLHEVERAGLELVDRLGAIRFDDTVHGVGAVASPSLAVTIHIGTVYAHDPRGAEQAAQDVAYAIAQALRRRGLV